MKNGKYLSCKINLIRIWNSLLAEITYSEKQHSSHFSKRKISAYFGSVCAIFSKVANIMLTCKATFPSANYGNNYIVNWKKQLRTHFLLCGLQTKRVISKPMKLLKSTQCIRFIIILHQGFNIIYRKWRTKTLFVVDPGSIRWTTFINQMNNSIYRKLRKNSLLNISFLQDGIETCHIISSRKKNYC